MKGTQHLASDLTAHGCATVVDFLNCGKDLGGLHALEQVLAGESQLDEIVDALVAAERAEQLGES